MAFTNLAVTNLDNLWFQKIVFQINDFPNGLTLGVGSSSYTGAGTNGTTSGVLSFIAPSAGTFTLTALMQKSTDRGIIKLKINGVVVDTVDLYSASANSFYLWKKTGIELKAGVNTIEIYNDGKNGASSNYGSLGDTFFTLLRTA
jgi:hypothetical protein